MNVDYLIQLLTNRINILLQAKDQAYISGDLDRINKLDAELVGVQNTLSQLQVLQQMNQAAAASNVTTADIASIGLYTMQNTTQGPSAGAVINGYDISAYATDAQYEGKIQAILDQQPVFTTASSVDAYIETNAPGSPVTGDMVVAATAQYAVDIQLLMAIIELDSRFGTLGVGARTNNPGNVGNTGSATQTFPSWADGVAAVAAWLNNHRVSTTTTDTTATSTSQTTTSPSTSTAPATTTPAVVTPVSTTTPEMPVATTTPAIVATSTPATTGLSASTTPAVAATSTPAASDVSTSTTTPATPPLASTSATSTPDTSATTTPATSTGSSTPSQ